MGETLDVWPAGATWVFQGTVAEDATAGTHVCSLTVTPGAGNELEVLYGQILDGNTATSQTITVTVTDGANELVRLVSIASTTVLYLANFPGAVAGNSTLPAGLWPGGIARIIVSGTMQLVLKVSTTAVSVTQTFAVACRIKGGLPTATLLDTIGTSTNTTNTNAVF